MKKLKLPFEKVDTLPNCEATYKVEESIWNPTEFKKIVENNLGKYMVDNYLGSEVTEDDIDKVYDDCPTLICTYSLLNKLLKEEDKLDKVNPVAVKKKFKDRKDQDIDNDGDVDDSDKFLHKRRKAISKAVAK